MGMWTSKEDKLLISLLKDSSLLEEKPLTYYFPDRKVLGLAGRARYLAKKYNIKIKDPIRLTENSSIFVEAYRFPRQWNSEEDTIVIKKVEQYPTNLSYAFREASKLLPNRKLEAIRSRYYNSLRKKHKYTITTGSQKGFSNNVKNQRIDDDGKLTKQELEPVHIVMAQMLNLPEKDRKRLLAFFNC